MRVSKTLMAVWQEGAIDEWLCSPQTIATDSERLRAASLRQGDG
jgi:hypothetical protein